MNSDDRFIEGGTTQRQGQVYELFDEFGEHCSPPLPVQISTDRFTYAGLIALTRSGRPATMPAYRLVGSESLGELADLNRESLLSAAPLVNRWQPPEALRRLPPPARTVRVALDRLIAEDSVTVGEDSEPLPLSAENVREVLYTGRTTLQAGEGDAQESVVVVADLAIRGTTADLVLPVVDVAAFLAAPQLPGGATPALTPEQIAALLAGERVRIEATDDDVAVTLVRADVAADTGTGAVSSTVPYGFGAPFGGAFPAAGIEGAPGIEIPPGKVEAGWQLPDGYQFVLWCPYRQFWSLLGYTRGGLLNSIPLAPQEETTVEIFSWDRRVTVTETSMTDETESTTTTRQTVKDSNQVVREAQRQRGWSANGKGNIGVNIGIVSLGGEAGGTIGKQLNDNARRTHDEVVDATDEATQHIKAVRQTRVNETSEIGSETRVTRTLRNTNMTRTLTFDYFEMLASYSVETRLDKREVRLCLLVPDVLPGEINRYFVLHHEGALRAALTSEVYVAGFDAVRLLAEFEATCEVACGAGCECEQQQCLCEPPAAAAPAPAGGQPPAEPAPSSRTCIPLPLPILPGHSIELCRTSRGQISVRVSGPILNTSLTGENQGTCLRFPVPMPIPPAYGFIDVCTTGVQISVRIGVGVWPFGETWSTQIWSGRLDGNTGPATGGAGAGGTTTTAPGTVSVSGGCAGCSGSLPPAVSEQLGHLADAIIQLELATAATVGALPQTAVSPAWIRTVHSYLYRTLALELACPAFWQNLRTWAHLYRPGSPRLDLLRQALRQPRDRIVTMAMLPHAMLSEYGRLIRETGALLGYPRSDLVARNAGFFDQGFESALSGVRGALAALAALPCPEAPRAAPAAAGSAVAGGPLGSGNWTVEELARRLLNPILWTVEKLYEGWTTDEPPPDLSFIEEGGVGAALTAAAIRIARDGPLPTRMRGYDVRDIARAVVAEQQLLGHLSANEGHYRQAVWNAMDTSDRFNLLSARGDRLLDHVVNDVIGFVGRSAVLTFRPETEPAAAGWMRENVLDSDEFLPPTTSRTETVPTKGIAIQPRLGACDTAEAFVLDLRAAEVKLRRADVASAEHRAAQAEQEARRRKQRLDANPPNLDDPVNQQGPMHISLDKTHGRTEGDGGTDPP